MVIKMRILIADDLKGSRDVLRYLIQKYEPAQIFEATNGIEALEIIKLNHIDILITDIKMPQMDGIELIEKARQILPDLQIIVFSAFANFEFAKKALQFGVMNYLLKPINTEEFYKTLNSVVKNYHCIKNKLIWNNFDEITLSKNLSKEVLPYPLNTYSHLLLITCNNDESLNEEEILGFIKECFPEAIIKEKQNSYISLINAESSIDSEIFLIYSNISKESKCSIYITDFQNNCTDLYNSFQFLIKNANENLFWELPHNIYNLNKNQFTNSASDITVLFKKAKELGKYIIQHTDNYDEKLDALIDEIQKNALNSNQCKYVFLEIIKQIATENHNNNSYQQLLESITTAKRISELKESIYMTVALLCELQDLSSENNTYSPITQAALRIIHTEYMDDISRTSVAGRIYMSSTYFSHLFKKETGKNFTQYLNDYRMNQACNLLKNTTHNIYSIAKMVGFNNYPYFCSQFKKQYGQTCIQYRETHFKEGD